MLGRRRDYSLGEPQSGMRGCPLQKEGEQGRNPEVAGKSSLLEKGGSTREGRLPEAAAKKLVLLLHWQLRSSSHLVLPYPQATVHN